MIGFALAGEADHLDADHVIVGEHRATIDAVGAPFWTLEQWPGEGQIDRLKTLKGLCMVARAVSWFERE